MLQIRKHNYKYSIADSDAVEVLLEKLSTPTGSRDVDEEKLYKALHSASRRYSQSGQEVGRAFFSWLADGIRRGTQAQVRSTLRIVAPLKYSRANDAPSGQTFAHSCWIDFGCGK